MFHALCIWLANKDSAEVNSLIVNPFPPNKQAGQLDKCNCSFLLLLCQDLPTPHPSPFPRPSGDFVLPVMLPRKLANHGCFSCCDGVGRDCPPVSCLYPLLVSAEQTCHGLFA